MIRKSEHFGRKRVSCDFLAENKQRMLNSPTFCEFLPERWRIVFKNWISARIYHEVLKNLASSLIEIFAEKRTCV
jgi:hypothetical protein